LIFVDVGGGEPAEERIGGRGGELAGGEGEKNVRGEKSFVLTSGPYTLVGPTQRFYPF
jgi:hypothetical protein